MTTNQLLIAALILFGIATVIQCWILVWLRALVNLQNSIIEKSEHIESVEKKTSNKMAEMQQILNTITLMEKDKNIGK